MCLLRYPLTPIHLLCEDFTSSGFRSSLSPHRHPNFIFLVLSVHQEKTVWFICFVWPGWWESYTPFRGRYVITVCLTVSSLFGGKSFVIFCLSVDILPWPPTYMHVTISVHTSFLRYTWGTGRVREDMSGRSRRISWLIFNFSDVLRRKGSNCQRIILTWNEWTRCLLYFYLKSPCDRHYPKPGPSKRLLWIVKARAKDKTY